MRIHLLFFAIALGFVANALGYNGAVSSASGNTGRAAIESSEVPFANPAGVAFLKGYYFSAGYGSLNQKGSLGSAQDMAFSLTDNMKETVVPTSLAYTQTTVKPKDLDDTLERNFRLSFGNFWNKNLAAGLAVEHKDNRLIDKSYAQTNLHLGLLYSRNENWGFALVMENLLKPSDQVPEAYRQKQTTALGTSFNYKRFARFKADLASSSGNSISKPTAGVGVESYLNKWLIFRVGTARNTELEANLYSVGTGFIGPKFALNYAYQNSSQDQSLTRHSVDLAVPIW
jgi:hypothetical protein